MTDGWHFNASCDQWEFWWRGQIQEVQTMAWLRWGRKEGFLRHAR